jgi:hypothetical protein
VLATDERFRPRSTKDLLAALPAHFKFFHYMVRKIRDRPSYCRGTSTMSRLSGGIALLLASVLAGGLWNALGPQSTFLAEPFSPRFRWWVSLQSANCS